jgi:threonine dehydrogenase-like Zn-dependent dehydrogenase
MPTVEDLRLAGELGGRTAQVNRHGEVECATYEPVPLPDGAVRLRTVRSAISPGTEMTFIGSSASNVYLHKRWNPELRVFQAGGASIDFPMPFGYRACGEVVESNGELELGARIWGRWRHTELVAIPADEALAQRLPDGLTWDDGVDIGQMGPICVNAALFGQDEAAGRSVVVFGAGPVGLITAQVVRAGGAASVTVVDRVEHRLQIAADLGFEALSAADEDVAVALKRRHGSDGIPVAWECSGAVPALHEAIRTVARRGLVVAVGFYQGGAAALELGDEFHHNGVRITGGQIGNPAPGWDRRRLQERTLELCAAGDVVLGGLPRDVVPIDRVAEAFTTLRDPVHTLQIALDYR